MDESLETVKKEANKHELKKSVEEKIQQMEKLLQSQGLSLDIYKWNDLEELKEEAKQFGEYLKFRDHTEQRERDEAKIQELETSLAGCAQECEALREKSKKLETDRDEFILSIAEKEQSLFFQQKENEKQLQEIEEKTKVIKGLKERLRLQEREHQKLKSSRTQEYEALKEA